MSADNISEKERIATDYCANCGIAAVDEIELKDCSACHLVQYCSVKCQKEHRPKHERECKQRAAELHDEILFKQPECSHLGDCPICFLPMPLDRNERGYTNCCSTLICHGCFYIHSSIKKGRKDKCPFCRTIMSISDEEKTKSLLRRTEANDPLAMYITGEKYIFEEDYENAFQYFTKAVEAGNMDARFRLGWMYQEGNFVEKDDAKCISHWQTAAVRGHIGARISLGHFEFENRRYDRAMKHWIISASSGDNDTMQLLKNYYRVGHVNVSKDDLARALRAHQAAVDAMKSPQREVAKKVRELFSLNE